MMKRLLAVFVALMTIVGTAWCAPTAKGAQAKGSPLSLKGLTVSPQAKEKLAGNPLAPTQKSVLKKMKALTPTGEEWDMTLTYTGLRSSDVLLINGEPVSFFDLPYYIVNCTISKLTEEGQTEHQFNLNLFWPTKSFYYENNDYNLAEFDDIVAYTDDTFNTFSTQGNIFEGMPHLQIWRNTNDLYTSTVNGEPYYSNMISEELPTTVRFNKNTTESGYDIVASVNLANDILGTTHLDLSTRYDATPESFDVTNFARLYLIGEPQNWDVNNANVPVWRISETSRLYQTNIYIPAGKFRFRFYGATGDWDSFSIGSQDYDSPMEIAFDADGVYEGPLVEGDMYSNNGKGSWEVPGWEGGRVIATVDLDNRKVTFRKMAEPEALYPIYYNATSAVDPSQFPLAKIADRVYSGIIDIPEELRGDGNYAQLLFSDKSNNLYSDADYIVIMEQGDSFEVRRTERTKNIAITRGSTFTVANYAGTRLEVTVDFNNGTVTMKDPDAAPLAPEEITMNFAPDTPETLEIGVPTDITLTFPAGELDRTDIYIIDGSGNYDILSRERTAPGSITYTVISNSTENVSISFYNEYYPMFGIDRLSRSFTSVAPEFAKTNAKEIYAVGKTVNGDFQNTLTKVSDGVYSGTIDINPDNYTAFRISIPTENGDVTVGKLTRWDDWIEYNDEKAYLYIGEGTNTMRTYRLQDMTHSDAVQYYLGVPGNNSSLTKLTVDLNTMRATLTDPNFVPTITIEKPEVKAKTDSWFQIKVKGNVLSELLNSDEREVTIDNPEICYLSGSWWYDDETGVFDFYASSPGETLIHITSPSLKEAGLEGTVKIIVGDFKTEKMTVSTPELVIRQGEYETVEITTEPFPVWISSSFSDNGTYSYPRKFGEWNNTGYSYLITVLGDREGVFELCLRPDDNRELMETVKVTVLPKDAKVAEHIVFMRLEPGATTVLNLDTHADGTEAAPAWSSSNEAVATVSADGTVTAVSEGQAVITSDCGEHQVMMGVNVKTPAAVDQTVNSRVCVYSQGTAVTVTGAEEGETVNIYAADGSLMGSRLSDGTAIRFDLGARGAYVVTAGAESFKVVL